MNVTEKSEIVPLEEMMERAAVVDAFDGYPDRSERDILNHKLHVIYEASKLIKDYLRSREEKSGIILPENCKRCQEMVKVLQNKKQYMLPLITIGVMIFILGVAVTLALLTAFGQVSFLNIYSYFVLALAAISLIITSLIAIRETEKVLDVARQNISKK